MLVFLGFVGRRRLLLSLMDKSWMKKKRGTSEYVLGVNEFLGFASKSMGSDERICCPCVKCVNYKRYNISTVHDHLVQYGMSPGYDYWFAHGELRDRAASSHPSISVADNEMCEPSSGMHELLHEAHRYILFNCDELIQIRTMHKERLKARNRSSRPTDYVIDKMHRDEFCDWFRNYVQNMDETMKHQLPNRVRWLAKGTMTRKRFRTISSSSQPPVPPSQEATASQEATPSQPPAHPSEQATMPSFDYDQSLNDNEIIGDTEVRKVRGGTRMTDVWNLKEDELIPVQFNGNGQPLGNEGGIFNKFTGCVARVANQIPLDAADWRKVPLSIKEDCWSLMTKRFTIPEPPLGDIVKSWFLKDLGEKWRNYKCSLKQKFFDEAFTPQYVKNNAPTDVNLEQFCKLVDFWFSDAGRHRSHAGKQNRSLQTTVHTAGSKSFARYAHELEKEKQVPINRADLYKAVHMRSDGSPINPDVAEKIRRMEEIGLNDSGSSQTSNEFRVDGSIGWSPSDRYAQVIGPERHGRIRGVGLGPTPSSHPANTNEQRQYQDVPNNNHVSPAIHRSSHASRKTSVADNVDDAESAGADGAEGGED
ncbi:hypothetical protein CJ030_MR2G006078 [Morella rubra]|uniref:Transposase-associated domain-containing protein n=2 Tax=Morella rubra TaxID=262757 RepID=A0A6A1WE91_9ROSI|nr:hypothetical protein CJ030_MR2G006078 [Morella rubra]